MGMPSFQTFMGVLSIQALIGVLMITSRLDWEGCCLNNHFSLPSPLGRLLSEQPFFTSITPFHHNPRRKEQREFVEECSI